MIMKRFQSLLLIFIILIGCEKPLEGWNRYVHSEDAFNAQKAITGQRKTSW